MISTQMCYLCPRTLRYLSPKSKHLSPKGGEGIEEIVHQLPCKIFSTLPTSGSTTIVLLRFLSAVSGSLSPWPVSVHTTIDPGRSPPVAAYLSAPATEAAEAGSAKIPCAAIN